jgi:molecular chaperone GrpE (heat shock protein)
LLLERISSLERQVSLLPNQVRLLGAKVEGLTTAVAEPRVRSLLMGLLGVFDLVDQVLRTGPASAAGTDQDHKRNYEVLKMQLGVLLESNGLFPIPADGPFDPRVHIALQSVSVEDPAKAGQVLEIVRPGFRTEQAVLRYAEVLVGRYAAPAPPPAEDAETPAAGIPPGEAA